MNILRNALWVGFSLTDPGKIDIGQMLPAHLHLAPVSPLHGMPAEPMLLFNAYKLTSRWMNGVRLDVQTLAVDERSRTPHLVILDVLTDTLSWDPLNGITPPNAIVSFTTTGGGMQTKFTDVKTGQPLFKFRTDDEFIRHPIDFTFCVEANRKCYYRNNPVGFDMCFNEEQIMEDVNKATKFDVSQAVCERLGIAPVGRPVVAFTHPQEMNFDVGFSLLSSYIRGTLAPKDGVS